MALEREYETFRKELPHLLAVSENRDKFVLIAGDKVDSVWPTIDAALTAGYEHFDLAPFLVEKITDAPETFLFVRKLIRCR